MLLAMILLIVIGIIVLVLVTLCRVAMLADMHEQLLLDPEYLEDEELEEDQTV